MDRTVRGLWVRLQARFILFHRNFIMVYSCSGQHCFRRGQVQHNPDFFQYGTHGTWLMEEMSSILQRPAVGKDNGGVWADLKRVLTPVSTRTRPAGNRSRQPALSASLPERASLNRAPGGEFCPQRSGPSNDSVNSHRRGKAAIFRRSVSA
jgi:hypothetical protein